VVEWSGFLATDPEVPVPIPGHYKEKKVVGLERGPLSLVSTTEELLGRKSSGSGLESREYSRRDFFLFIYSFGVGLESPFCQLQAIHIKRFCKYFQLRFYIIRTQNTHKHPYLSGIRNHDPSVGAGEDSSCLRPRGHCDRQP
jgi:hypothetical protein